MRHVFKRMAPIQAMLRPVRIDLVACLDLSTRLTQLNRLEGLSEPRVSRVSQAAFAGMEGFSPINTSGQTLQMLQPNFQTSLTLSRRLLFIRDAFY